MRTLTVFNHTTLDGYFTDANNDMSWAHRGQDDAEWNAYVRGNASGGGTLLFGRVTYQMMAGFWPTETARKNNPAVAERMNSADKIVVSRTLERAEWNNTRLIKDNLIDAVRALKQESGEGIVILGSGSVVAQLAQAGLIDNYQLVINPVAIGAGRTLFDGMQRTLRLKLTGSRAFANGNVVLGYVPG